MKKIYVLAIFFLLLGSFAFAEGMGEVTGKILDKALEAEKSSSSSSSSTSSLQPGAYYQQIGGDGSFFVISIMGSQYKFEVWELRGGRNIHTLTAIGYAAGNTITTEVTEVNTQYYSSNSYGQRAVFTIVNSTTIDNSGTRFVRR